MMAQILQKEPSRQLSHILVGSRQAEILYSSATAMTGRVCCAGILVKGATWGSPVKKAKPEGVLSICCIPHMTRVVVGLGSNKSGF